MYGISGYNMMYPNQFQVTANPQGAALAQLNSDFASDFGLGMPQTYDMPVNVTAGYAGMGGGMGYGLGLMGPYGMYNQQYLKYLNMDFKDRLEYDAELRKLAMEGQYNAGKLSKNYASANDNLTAPIREACNTLQTIIVEGDTEQVVAKFEEIVDMVRRSPVYERLKSEFANDPVSLEKALRNAAKDQFQAVTGQDLKAMIQQYCDSAIVNSFWNAISFGNAQVYSAETLIAKLEGSDTPKSKKTKQTFGKIGAGTATTAAGGAIGFAIGGPVGALVGAGIGLTVGIIGSLSK